MKNKAPASKLEIRSSKFKAQNKNRREARARWEFSNFEFRISNLLIFAALFLASCSLTKPVSDPASRHLLDPSIPWRAANAAKPALAVARPSLPSYLDRQQLVARDDGGGISVLDNHLWSEPLDSGISRVLAANLSRLTGSSAILPVGNFITLDYSALVEVRVEQFDPAPSGVLVLECAWKVQPVSGADTPFKSYRTEVAIPATTSVMAGRISSMNEALARLAREITRGL